MLKQLQPGCGQVEEFYFITQAEVLHVTKNGAVTVVMTDVQAPQGFRVEVLALI